MIPYGALLAVAVSAGLLWLFLQYRAERQRASLFDSRDAPDFDAWYERYYANESNPPNKAFVEKTLDAFGDAFGIEPTRFRPSDRIEGELRLKGVMSLDDAWETVDALLAGRFDRSFDWSEEWRTLDNVIRGLAIQWQASER
jgi:hypothetical protein